MDYKLRDSNIIDENIDKKLCNKIKFDKIDKTVEYDLSADFYNSDLIEDNLNDEVAYEIKRKHYQFIRAIRTVFEKNNVKINKVNLCGTIVDISEGEIIISLEKSKYRDCRDNNIWPCKEIFIYEDGKKTLDIMLGSNQISMDEYEENLMNLQEELSIYEREEENSYLN